MRSLKHESKDLNTELAEQEEVNSKLEDSVVRQINIAEATTSYSAEYRISKNL
ncbi:hypothetical protein DPMN_140088 [Dreissena polymorpha]|uniref:Uncharacterized protein n=1 Tax=Dreissena polymorpha TaxID=45954 RepID=A0A9D4GA74_DREPO|nr:hypothetical protein DPMN_140088 [Dreissena polymorpha]